MKLTLAMTLLLSAALSTGCAELESRTESRCGEASSLALARVSVAAWPCALTAVAIRRGWFRFNSAERPVQQG